METILPSGKKAKLQVRYGTGEIERWVPSNKTSKRRRVKIETKTTTVRVTVLNGETPELELVGGCDCVPEDNFSRADGRKMAMRRALDQDANHFLTKEDRRAIVRSLFPTLFHDDQ